MTKNRLFLAALVTYSCSALGGINKNSSDVPGHRLVLEQEVYFTDKQGIAIPEQIAKAEVGKLVKIYRPDGFCYEGKVTEIEEADGLLKVYGEVLNLESGRFGFALAKGGKFAGAVLDKNSDTVYVLEFSDVYKGFVLKRSYRYDKITS